MNWGNFSVSSIDKNQDGSLSLKGLYLPDDKDFKSTKKVNWLPNSDILTEVEIVEYDHLLNAKKLKMIWILIVY